MLIFTDGNETWPGTGGGTVAITNSLQPVEVEVETGFMVDTDYTVIVIVFTEYANMSSSAGFSKSPAYSYSYALPLTNPWNACMQICFIFCITPLRIPAASVCGHRGLKWYKSFAFIMITNCRGLRVEWAVV